MRRLTPVVTALLVAGALVACGPDEQPRSAATPSATTGAAQDHQHGSEAVAAAGPERPLRDGERRLDLVMPEAYSPSAPTQGGTDDYRCFLLDPSLEQDTFVTGVDVRPGNPDVVHHVILF